MINQLLKGIKQAQELGILNDVVEITYTGKGVSLNDFYSQGHWSKRSQIKKKYRKIFDVLLEESKLQWLDKFYLLITYNSRHDPDNVIGMGKVFVDALKQESNKAGDIIREGYIREDDKRYYRGVAVFPDESLPMNTFKFLLIEDND